MNVLSIIHRLRDVQVGGCNFTRLTVCALEFDYRFWSRNGTQIHDLSLSMWYFLIKQLSTGLAKQPSSNFSGHKTAWFPKNPFGAAWNFSLFPGTRFRIFVCEAT